MTRDRLRVRVVALSMAFNTRSSIVTDVLTLILPIIPPRAVPWRPPTSPASRAAPRRSRRGTACWPAPPRTAPPVLRCACEGARTSASDTQHDAAATARRFNALVGLGDPIERQGVRDLESRPPRPERLGDRTGSVGLLGGAEVVAAHEVHSDVLEHERPEREGGGVDSRRVG